MPTPSVESDASPRGAWFWIAVLAGAEATAMLAVGLARHAPGAGVSLALSIAVVILQAWRLTVSAVRRPTAGGLALTAGLFILGAVIWTQGHVAGFPGLTGVWRAETPGVPELYEPALEIVAGLIFACLAVAGWSRAPRPVRALARHAPTILLVLAIVAVVVTLKSTQLILAILVLDAAPQISMPFVFLPLAGALLAFIVIRQVSPALRARTPRGLGVALALVPAGFVLVLLGWGGAVSAAQTAWFSKATPIRVAPGQSTTLGYCWPGDAPLAMDIARPLRASPAPVVVFIHGGETMLGSRVLDDGSPDGPYFQSLRRSLLTRGIGFASIDYRLAPLTHVGTQVSDAKCAIRFLRAHAAALGVDPTRIGVIGPSQGGYLSSMVGLTARDAGPRPGEYPDQSSVVQAVADLWGPADLTDWSGSPKWVAALVRGPRSALGAASPVNHVDASAPPFLILQGADDWFIAPHHSIALAKRLRQAGASVQFILIRNDGHGLAAATAGKSEQPTPADLTAAVVSFFVTKLGSAADRPTERR